MKKFRNLLLSKKAFGMLFGTVLILNIFLFVNKDSKNAISLRSLKAVAQYYGEDPDAANYPTNVWATREFLWYNEQSNMSCFQYTYHFTCDDYGTTEYDCRQYNDLWYVGRQCHSGYYNY